jgi:hypothetical protein
MKTLSSDLQTLLYTAGGAGMAECWSFYFSSGTLYWTSAQADVTYGGTTWHAGQVGIKKGRMVCGVGTAVDTLDVQLFGSVTIGGATLMVAALGLAFSGIRAVCTRIYFDATGAAKGSIIAFDGFVYGMVPETDYLKLTLKSPMAKADSPRGTRVIQVSCPFALGDSNCGASFITVAGTVSTGSTTTQVNLAASNSAATPGSQLSFTSGALNGVNVLIRSVSGSQLTVDPLPSAPVNGVTVSVSRGCGKTRSECAVFSNIARFGGFVSQPADNITMGS